MDKDNSLRNTKTLLFLLVSFLSFNIIGQETIFEEKTTIYSSEMSGSISMNTNGYSASFRYAKYLGAFKKQFYEFEIGNIKHPREIKSISPRDENVRGFVFGKLNALYVVRPTIGIQKVFIPKQSIKGVSVAYVASIGPSFGFEKPVYLNIERISNNQRVVVKERYDPDKHNINDIYGRASFLNGFGQLKLNPGIHGKLGFHFDYASERERVKAIEVGLMVDGYFRPVPILAYAKNRAVFTNLYLAIYFGKREVK